MAVKLASSTAAMISPNSLKYIEETNSLKIVGKSMTDNWFCHREPFSSQVMAATCSGFLIGEDIIATAGHCVKDNQDCRKYLWAFDYKMPKSGKWQDIDIPLEDIYECEEVIKRVEDYFTLNDYALIRLTRSVKNREPLKIRKEGKVSSHSELMVIGNPTELPTKISDKGDVRQNSNLYYFSTNLDTYAGNSGSAVFDTKTGIVEGILVRGGTDFVDRKFNCSDLIRRGGSEVGFALSSYKLRGLLGPQGFIGNHPGLEG